MIAIPVETFKHIFMDCPTVRTWQNQFLDHYFPVNYIRDEQDRTNLFFLGRVHEPYTDNHFIILCIFIFQYTIGKPDLKNEPRLLTRSNSCSRTCVMHFCAPIPWQEKQGKKLTLHCSGIYSRMEDKMSDQCRGMAPSEMMQKICSIDPEGLLGDSGENGENGDQDQEMQETHSRGSEVMEEGDDNPAIHRNIHVVSASEEDGSEGEKDERTTEDATATAAEVGSTRAIGTGQARSGSEKISASTHAGVCTSKEKSFIIVDIQKKITDSKFTGPALVPSAKDSSSGLMPPPKSIPVATYPVPVPDPKSVKEIFQQRAVNSAIMEKPPTRAIAEIEGDKTGNEKNRESSGYSADSGSKNSENVLPKLKPVPAEADLIPPKTYKAIVANKKTKEKVGTIGGITSGQDPIECGSFYNSSDNRVARSVYKEDLVSMSVTLLSFNPKSWMCTACPKSHSVVGEGGRGGLMVGRSSLSLTKTSPLCSPLLRAAAWRSCAWSRPRWMT